MPRTLVEILALDQQDVFYASTLAWLLDPRQEHGLGTALLQDLSMALSEQDKPELALELSMAPSPTVEPKVAIVSGKSIRNVVPAAILDSIAIRPPSLSTASCTIAMPSPRPERLVISGLEEIPE